MGQFDKDQKIEFVLDNIESIRDALKRYQMLLQNDEVVINQVFDIEFVHVEDGKIKPLQVKHGDTENMEEFIKYSVGNYTYGEIDFNDTTSEGIFFSHALKYEELLDEVVKTAKEIVHYARRHNDTWEMWADDMTVFGIDPIYILAKKHPEYTYLMGAYVIPYWDTEHADYVMGYLRNLYLERGFDDEVMKAFCYCDNSEGRNALINNGWYGDSDNFDLVQFFKNNPEKYQLFKDMMKERFKDQRYIQYSDQSHTDSPIEEFYGTILWSSKSMDEYDDYEDMDLETMFIDDTYDNEAYQLHQEIEAYVGEPLTDPYKDPYADYEDEEDEEEIWEDFFINGFEQGEEIWNYILYGEDDSVLSEIKPTDIMKLAKEKNLLIQKKIDWHIGEFDSFESEFYRLFENFINEYYEENNSGFIMKINGVDPTGRDTVIRALDVFTLLLDHPVYHYDLYEVIVSYGIMKPNQFIEKYDLQCECFTGGLCYLIAEASSVSYRPMGDELNRIYEFMKGNREEALILLKGEALVENKGWDYIEKHLSPGSLTIDSIIGLLKKGLEIKATSLRFATYILNKDYENRVMDELTQYLMGFVENNWVKVFLEILREESTLTEEELSQVKKHIIGKPMPPRELMIKVMKEGPDALTGEEKALLNPKGEVIELEEILPILQEKLEQEVDEDDPQVHYEIFNSHEEEYMHSLIPVLYLGTLKVRIPSSQSMKRAMKLLMELAPMRVMKSAFNISSQSIGNGNMDGLQLYDFRRDMGSLCSDRSKVLAWEILEGEEDRYQALVQAYIDDEDSSGFSMIKSESRADIEKALGHLSYHEKRRFYDAVEEEDEGIISDGEIKMFYDTIPDFVKDHLISKDQSAKDKIHKISKDLIEYMEGNIDIHEIEYIKDEINNLSGHAPFTRGIWKIDEERRLRLLLFLKKFGIEGVEMAFSRHEVEAIDYLAILLDIDTPYEVINSLLIDIYDEDAYCEFAMRLNPYDYVKNMSIEDRLRALEMASQNPSLVDFIGDMAKDPSAKIRGQVDEILGNYAKKDLEKYKDLLMNSFNNSNEDGKRIIEKYIK